MGSKLDDLKTALAGSEATDDAGFASIADAMTELSADAAALNDLIANPDVTEITAEITAKAASNAEKFAGVAQAIRDAITPPAPVEPAP